MNKDSRKIRVIIVDDEVHARDELQYLLEQDSDVCVINKFCSYQEALEAVKNGKPHLIFMDIEMPGISGIKAAEEIMDMDRPPLVVFATAHEEFALRAFELDAVDYLLKPFSAKRVAKSINRVRRLMEQSSVVELKKNKTFDKSADHMYNKTKLAIEHNAKATIVDTSDIIVACYCEGQLKIYTQEQKYQCNMSLQDLQARLDDQCFFRSHRAYIVNIEKVREIIPWFNGTYNLTMEGLSIEVPVSRQQAPKLKKIFGL